MMVVADDITDRVDQFRFCRQFFQNFLGNGWTFHFLIFGGGAAVLPFGLMDADVMQVGRGQDHGHISPFTDADPLRISRHPCGVPDPFEVLLEIPLHFNGDPILQQIFFLGQQLFGQGPQALLGELAVCGAAEIHLGIDKPVPAFAAFAGGVVLEKFDVMTAFRALDLKYRSRFPILGVLSRAFHGEPPFLET